MSYELFYSSGGHGGPYETLEDARDAAKRLLTGCRTMHTVEILQRGDFVGGYGPVVERVSARGIE